MFKKIKVFVGFKKIGNYFYLNFSYLAMNRILQNHEIITRIAEENPPIQGFDNESIIWREFKMGNEAAFIQIYQQFFEVLFNFGNQFTSDQDLVQDCIQDIFIEIRKNRKNLTFTTSIKKYLFKAMKRKIIYQLKKKRSMELRHQRASQFELEFSIEDRIINKQLTEEKALQIKKSMERLPQRQREAIYYFYYENMKYEEIAEIMNLSKAKSARNLIYKALSVLRSNLIIEVASALIFCISIF